MKCGYEIYAYCLMGNHLHILMKTGSEPLEQVMRRICGSYVYWYNRKYERIGNLFQDRFKSEPIENDSYLLTVLRYIHQNPIMARVSESAKEYRWSSYSEYLGKPKLVDISFVLNIFSNSREKAIERFVKYNNEVNEDFCLDIEEKHRLTDEEACIIIKQEHCIKSITDLQVFDIARRNVLLRDMKQKYGLSIRQIERITGINRGVVLRA